MGEHDVEQQVDEKKAQAFMKALLENLRALALLKTRKSPKPRGAMRVDLRQQ